MSTPITVLGTLGDYLWIDQNGPIPVRTSDLHNIATNVINDPHWHTTRDGVHWSLADIVYLSMTFGLGTIDQLDPCTRCRELPVIGAGELCWVCADVVQTWSDEVRHTLGGAA
jgi:hypothetical protein